MSAQQVSGDELAVYRAVLDTLYHQLGARPPLIVLRDSTQLRYDACSTWPCVVRPKKAVIAPETIKAYEALPQTRIALPSPFEYSIPVALVAPPDSDWTPFWESFRARYPGAWGIASLSRIAFDPGHREALLQVQHSCYGCNSFEEMFLRKVEGRWVVAERILESGGDHVDIVKRIYSPSGDGRDSIVLGSQRYLGPDARFLARTLEWRDSIRKLIQDSIAADRLPRRIHGRVINKKTGWPISFAQVFVISAHPYPTGSLTRVVADRLGRYEVIDPPIGGTMLELQCAGPKHVDGRTLDAPSLYVHQAIDTIVNLSAPDIAPCWPSRKLHLLSSGWLESAEAARAPGLASDEAAVYRAAIAHLTHLASGFKAVAIFSHTVEACYGNELCGSVQLARLEREGTIDSTIVRNFASKARSREAVNPAIAAAMGLRVISSQEIEYLAREIAVNVYPPGTPEEDTSRFWGAFKTLYGRNRGIISVTQVAFDPSRSRALVEVKLNVDQSHLGTYTLPRMMLLRRTNGTWRIEMDDIGIATGITSGEWADNRCRPVRAPSPPPRETVAAINGMFEVTLVPNVGSSTSGSVRMRLSPRVSRPFSPLIEIMDRKTGQPDERLALDFGLAGPGVSFKPATKVMRFDGSTYSLFIRSVTPNGFFGSWSAGVFGPSEFGHFCARRLSTPDPTPTAK